MRKILLRSSFALTAIALLAGCAGIMPESKKIDYQSAGKLPALEVPPDLTQPARDGRFTVPDVGHRGMATYLAYADERRAGAATTATGTTVLPASDALRIERAGTQRWLVVPGTPEQLWPQIKAFWQGIGMGIEVDLPEAGVMETVWAENRAKIPQDVIRRTFGRVFDTLYSTAERDRFRTRLERGAEPGVTEIYISHRGMYEIHITEGKDQTRWQPRPADPELEAEMLRRLMVSLGAEEQRARTLLAAERQPDRAQLARAADGSTTTLTLDEGFERAWRRVGLALDRVGFTVEDRDRAQGMYYVRYVDPEAGKTEDRGWLARLNPANLFRGTPAVDAKQQYRIHVQGDGQNSRVRVLTREGGIDTSETARKILALLFDQLK